MGFKRQGTVYRLVWPEGSENHGLEVRMGSLSIEQITRIGRMADLDLSADKSPEAMAALDEIMEVFASKLLGWNLEHGDEHPAAGEPVPATIEGVRLQDLDFLLELIDAWMTAVMAVAPPLRQSSSGGETSPVGSIPMEPLSASRAS